MTIDEIKLRLEAVLKPKRYIHSINVMDTAVKLAERYGENTGDAALAGLLHDCARNIEDKEAIRLCRGYGIETDEICLLQPNLLHGPLGSKLAREIYGVSDERILKAIEVHTTGHPGMDLLGKIIFIADYIEPARTFPESVYLREIAFADLDKAILYSLDTTIKYVVAKNRLLHPDTIDTRNWVLKGQKHEQE